MKGKSIIAWVAAAGTPVLAAGLPASAAPGPAAPASAPVVRPPATGPAQAPAAPTMSFAQAEALLKGRGLTLTGFTWVVPVDAKLPEALGKMRAAKAKQEAYVYKRKRLEQDAADADAMLAQAYADQKVADDRLAKQPHKTVNYNDFVKRANEAGRRVFEAQKNRDARNKALQDLPDSSGDYVGSLVELADAMDEASGRYEELAADPAVAAALAAINVTARPQQKVGPSAQFAQELRPTRFQRDQVASQAVPCKVGRNNIAVVMVKLNDADPVPMLVDSGASVINLTHDVAKQAGIVPGPNDPVIQSTIANGTKVDRRLVRARSVRVGPYLLHDVECAVGPASERNADCLLGGSFLKNFVVRMNLGGGQLHLTPIVKMKAVTKDSRAAPPTKTVGLANGRTEVTVPADRNADTAVTTGVRLAKGQGVVLTPSTADRWQGGTGKDRKPFDYQGNPDRAGSMRLRWKLGRDSGDVTPGTTVVAAEESDLMLYCNDDKPAGNVGSIRVTIAPGPIPVGLPSAPAPAVKPDVAPPAGTGAAPSATPAPPAAGTTPPVAGTPAGDRYARLKAAFPKPAAAGTPTALPLGDPLKDDVVWAATPNGYTLDGRIQIGNAHKAEFGGEYKGHVRAESGFRLEGGTIVLTSGTLELIGTPDRPVVLRNVKIGCEMFGTVKAKHAVFDGCTFYKAPGGYWTSGYTSKWAFDDCLVRNSKFDKLYRIDYGIKLRQTTFVDCAIPSRKIVDFANRDAIVDAAKQARHEWSEVAGCEFYGCTVSTSATWYMRECNLFGCTVIEPVDLNSDTELPVVLGLGPAEGGAVVEALKAKTTAAGTGKVTYAAAPPFATGAFPKE